MGKPIKVQIVNKNHSAGRGVGYYSELLIKSLKESSGITVTDDNPDITHYPFFDLFYHTLPSKFDRRTVVTVHDVTPLVMADRFPKGFWGTVNLFRQLISLRKVDAIITDSENSKKDLVKYLFINPEKINVTPLAVDPIYQQKVSVKLLQQVKQKYNLPDKFVLSVPGGPNPNKNLPSLAEVTERVGIPLVIVGGAFIQEVVHPVHSELLDLVRLKVYKHIIFPGFVPTEEVNAMYRLATLHVQASLYEGFGLPLLQAMTTKCLSISSRASSLPEIYPESTITFNPKSLKSMEIALVKALSMTPAKKQKNIELAYEKSKEFNWKRTAELTKQVYEKLL